MFQGYDKRRFVPYTAYFFYLIFLSSTAFTQSNIKFYLFHSTHQISTWHFKSEKSWRYLTQHALHTFTHISPQQCGRDISVLLHSNLGKNTFALKPKLKSAFNSYVPIKCWIITYHQLIKRMSQVKSIKFQLVHN